MKHYFVFTLRAALILILLFILSPMSPGVAQSETSTPLPESTETAAPPATATLLPTNTLPPTETLIPSSTTPPETTSEPPTVAPTTETPPEVTIEPTLPPETTADPTSPPEATTEPTIPPETTAEPTIPAATPTDSSFPPEPAMDLFFFDLFDDGDLMDWTAGAGWATATLDTRTVAQVFDSSEPLTLNFDNLYTVAAQTTFSTDDGTIYLSVRESAIGRYTVSLDTTGLVTLYRAGVPVQTITVASIQPDTWPILRLSAVGDVLRVTLDLTEILIWQDPAGALPPGKVSIHAEFAPPPDNTTPVPPMHTLQLDDVLVFLLQTEFPPATSTPTPTIPATAILTATPTPMPTETLPPEPELGYFFSDTFEFGETIHWILGDSWKIVYEQGNLNLRMLDANTPAQLMSDNLYAVVAEMRFQLNAGAVQLHVRQGTTQGYYVELDASGWLRLYRDGQEIAAQFVGAITLDQWHTLRLSVIADVIRVAVDGAEVIALQDAAPLPEGTVSFAGNAFADLLVKDFDLFLTMDEILARSAQQPIETPTESAVPMMSLQSDLMVAQQQASSMSQIVFTSNRDGAPYNTDEIYVMNADGSNQLRITNNSSIDRSPAWSPDSTQLIFESNRDSGTEIYIMDSDGTNVLRLTNNGVYDSDASWSPDNIKIAFESIRDGHPQGIYLMNIDGTNPQRLSGTIYADSHPSWSPDNTQIAFSSTRNGNGDVYIMDVDGSNVLRLTTNAASDYNPTWSPDGTQIAFTSQRDGSARIYRMNIDGSGIERISNGPGHDAAPSWSPDNHQITFQSIRDGDTEIYAIDLLQKCAAGDDPYAVTQLTNNNSNDTSPNWSTGITPPFPGECPPLVCPLAQVTSELIGRTQPAIDMLAIADETGLFIHEGPTLNANRVGAIPWATVVTINHWIEFPQTNMPNQVWYNITHGTQTGWVAARMSTTLPAVTTYSYFVGVDETTYPCQTDVNKNYRNVPNATFTFTYDREAAAKAAIMQSANNAYDPLLGAGITQSHSIVTRKIDNLPYARFVYDQTLGVPGFATGSAFFISEMYWLGGFPMTQLADPCSSDLAWRFCQNPPPNTGGDFSSIWRVHEGIVEYFTTEAGYGTNILGTYDDDITILDNINQGLLGSRIVSRNTALNDQKSSISRERLVGIYDENNILVEPGLLPDISGGGASPDTDFTKLSNFIHDNLNPGVNGRFIRKGDYAFINSGLAEDNHGLIVVGWQKAEDCPTAITRNYSISDFYETRELARVALDPNNLNVALVPFVSDFNRLQRPIARPFYCTAWSDPTNPDTSRRFFGGRHSWFFYAIPDVITVNLSQLYISDDWQWE